MCGLHFPRNHFLLPHSMWQNITYFSTFSWNVPLDYSFPNWFSYFFYSQAVFFFNIFIYFWDRERQSMSGGGAEREGDIESEAGSRLWAISTEPDAGLELTDCEIVTWAEVGHLTDWATQAPLCFLFEILILTIRTWRYSVSAWFYSMVFTLKKIFTRKNLLDIYTYFIFS